MSQKVYRTAIYARLSKDDGDKVESNSIVSQKALCQEYIQKHPELELVETFVDDGYSGVNFDRPRFKAMEDAIRKGRIDCVLCKDLSRFTRNYIEGGRYLERIFPQLGVRFIAINDSYDSLNGNPQSDSFIIPFKNLINDTYCKDISVKIRTNLDVKRRKGEFVGAYTPYGYIKDPNDPKKWIVDEEAAKVVKRIFALCMEGRGPTQIANLLTEEKVLNITSYYLQEGRNANHPEPADPYHWESRSISDILARREYTGCTVNFKTYSNSIWDKTTRKNPVENQAIFYNTHPAIIDIDTFDKVQEIREQRHRRTKSGNSHMFSGLVFCADCKGKMYFNSSSGEESKWFFSCSNARSGSRECTSHYIRAIVLERLVWNYTQRVIELVLRYEAHFRTIMEEKMQTESKAILKAKRKQLEKAEKRIQELDRLFVRTYEDNVAGKLSDERFAAMSLGYEEEQQGLKEAAEVLRKEIEVQEQQNQNLDLFIERIQKNTALEELTPYVAHELIKAIYVGAPDKSSGKRRQSIHIEYDLIGFIPLNELMKQETA